MKRALLLASLFLAAALALAVWRATSAPAPVPLTPSLTGKTEYCLTCHSDVEEISASHPTAVFGCVLCHGGERLALDPALAHSSLRGGANPAQLSTAAASCGGNDCHTSSAAAGRDHVQRVLTSIQGTYAGAIASLRYTFGAQPDLTARQGIYAVQDGDGSSRTGVERLTAFDPAAEANPALQTFAANCLNCHLSAKPPAGNEYARLEGCAACHSPVTDTAQPDPATGRVSGVHRMTTAIPYTTCNRCHNRGNYDLRSMTFVPRSDHPADRLGDYYQPIASFTRCEYELDCLDCHTRQEAMGGGDIFSSQAEAQYVTCASCHGTLTQPPLTRAITSPDDLALRLAFLNPVLDLKVGDVIVVTEQGEPLWNIRKRPDGSLEMVGKATRQAYTVPLVQGSACTQQADQQESRYCHKCHAVQR